MPISPLVANTDTDLTDWQAKQQDIFLEMACHEVRKYCGWHIAPEVSVSQLRCWFAARDYLMLPSTHVTEVSEVSICDQVLVADCDYFWDYPRPWMRRRVYNWVKEPFALVSFTHGYEECPPDVKAVIFELLSTAMELPASNASRFQTMQYTMELNPQVGIALSDQQKLRLGKYKLWKFGGDHPQ